MDAASAELGHAVEAPAMVPAPGAQKPKRQSDRANVSEVIREMADGRLRSNGTTSTPLITEFSPLDQALEGGFQRGDLSIIGGRPGVGKTVATLQWAVQFAKSGSRVLYHCYEHDLPSLFGRMLAAECRALTVRPDAADLAEIRAAVIAAMNGEWDSGAAYANQPIVRAALAQMDALGDRLVLSQLASATADLGMIERSVAEADEPFDVVFVDYVQKVPVRDLIGLDRYTAAIEGLKNLALTHHCHVVAISAVNESAMRGGRVHLDGLRGAHVLAHEADVIITLNRKLNIVAKSHLAFDTTLEQQFARTVVVSIEKNRRGLAPLDLEFETDFSHFRFNPRGRFVAERLVDGVVTAE